MSAHSTITPTERAPDHDTLRLAFDKFMQSAQVLEQQQRTLEARIAELDLELAETNAQLEASLETQASLANSLHNVLENLTTGVIAVDLNGIITSCNAEAGHLLQCDCHRDLVGKSVIDAVGNRLVHPCIGQFVAAGWVEGRSFEIPLDRSHSRTLALSHTHLRVSGSPASDVQSGEPLGGILVLEDITSLVQWRDRAFLNERLSTMGRVAAQVAHEIRNPLGSIELLSSALVNELTDISPRGAELASHIVASVGTLDGLVSNILLFARGREPDVSPVSWEEIARAAMSQTAHVTDRAGVQVSIASPSPAPAVLGDEELITQAVVNLIINASQALAQCSRPRVIELRWQECDDEASLEIADNGPGVPADLRDRIFDPFVTTKRRGTGLGLAIVSHIVTAHSGSIRCGEAPSGGAVFEITLPRADVPALAREGTNG